jgi:hypothetical protein
LLERWCLKGQNSSLAKGRCRAPAQAEYCPEMTNSGIDRLAELISNPPPGSKIEAAIQFGVDLTLNLRTLQLTSDERV